MIGTVALVVRFILYPLLGALAAAGIGVIDDAKGTFTVHIEDAVQVIAAAVLYVLTIVWSRIASKRPGARPDAGAGVDPRRDRGGAGRDLRRAPARQGGRTQEGTGQGRARLCNHEETDG